MLRFDLAVILIATALGSVWIERGHRVVIDAPAESERASLAAAACPDTDTVPYSAACLDYLNVATASRPDPQVVALLPAPAPCPHSDRVPYSPSCIAFLRGTTDAGMRWRATVGPASIPEPQ